MASHMSNSRHSQSVRIFHVRESIIDRNSHDLRIESFDAPPIMDANTEKEIPRIQSWAVTTAFSDIVGYNATSPVVSRAYCYDDCWRRMRGSRVLSSCRESPSPSRGRTERTTTRQGDSVRM